MAADEKEAAVEAMLFATGQAVSAEDLAAAAGVGRDEILDILHGMMKRRAGEIHGVDIIELDGSFQMCTRKKYYPQLISLVTHPRKPRLTDVLLETLSIIAYKQPVTKAEIERIRGVNSDHAVNKLVEYGLVGELGRAKMPGRPILFGTTQEFLRVFGVTSQAALPEISPLRLEDFREEAEEEADEKKSAEKETEEGQDPQEIH